MKHDRCHVALIDIAILQGAIQYFFDEQTCIDFLADIRWPDGKVVCMPGLRRQRANLKGGTIFEESPLSLSNWFPTVWLICGAKNGISSCEIARALGVTQKSAWFMMHRIRLAMNQGSFEKMSGEIEADETFIGGLSRNMHQDRAERTISYEFGDRNA